MEGTKLKVETDDNRLLAHKDKRQTDRGHRVGCLLWAICAHVRVQLYPHKYPIKMKDLNRGTMYF